MQQSSVLFETAIVDILNSDHFISNGEEVG